MAEPEPLTTYLELRESDEFGLERAGLSHTSKGLVLLHVLELAAWGEPRGGVTIVHDAGDHGCRYVELARILTKAHWAVALPDLRGHGRSEGPRGHSNGVKEIVRDLDAVQDHLAYRLPDAPKVLVGIGLGAIWALAYALEKPGALAGLALCSPRWTPRFEPPKQTGGLFKLFKKPGSDAPGAIGNDVAHLTRDPKERAAWKSDALVHDVITARAASQAVEVARDSGARLGELALPVLVLHGASDSIADANESKQRVGANVEVRIYDDMAHDLLHDTGRERVVEELRDWIAKLA